MEQQKKEDELHDAEIKFIFHDDAENTNETIDPTAGSAPEHLNLTSTSVQHAMNNPPPAIATRSELVLPANDKVNAATQVEFFHCDTQPPTRKTKVCTDDIKCALAEMTVAAQISPEKARMGAQAFAKKSSQLLTFS